MNEMWIVAGAGAMACGIAISGLMLRESTLEELRILLQTDSTDDIISARWGEEEFPAIFRIDWSADTRKSYMRLMRLLRKNKYGRSRELLHALIRIEDEQQAAKGSDREDAQFTERTRALIDSYKRNEDFSGFLAAFIEKRHMERI